MKRFSLLLALFFSFGLVAVPVAAADLQYGVSAEGGPLSSSGLAQLPSHGVTYFRETASWPHAEPSAPPAPYNWSEDDQIATTLAQSGLTWFPIAAQTPTWDQGSVKYKWSMPADPAPFGRYVRDFVLRYGPHGSFWRSHPSVPYRPVTAVEIWNEPNIAGFMQPQDASTPGKYYDLYAAARDDVHAVAPSVKVVSGGLAASDYVGIDPLPWLEQMEASRPGALANLDEVGIHPYMSTTAAMGATIAQLRALLTENGAVYTPIAITEVGYPVWGNTIGTYASVLSALTSELPTSNCNVSMLTPFAWQDTTNGGLTTSDGNWVLSLGSGQLTEAGSAYVQAIANAPSPNTNWCPGVAPADTVAPRVPGATSIGQTLTANPGTWAGSPAPVYSYQWQRTIGDTWEDIPGATAKTYTVGPADAGHGLRIVVTATNVAGSAHAKSAASMVTGHAPVKQTPPALSAQRFLFGQTLTVKPGQWSAIPSPTITYQWVRTRDGRVWSAIPSATQVSYTPGSHDLGWRVRALVTVTNAYGSVRAKTKATAPVGVPYRVVSPIITGVPRVGQVLLTTRGRWSSPGKARYSYQWQRAARGHPWANIAGAVRQNYTITSADRGYSLRVLVTATNKYGATPADADNTGTVR